VGDCPYAKPPVYEIENSLKYKGWNDLRGMDMTEAQRKFLEIAEPLMK